MNANAKMRMLFGCSILVAVCQTSVFAGGPGNMGASHLGAGAGGFGGMGASHLGTGISHVSVPSSVFKSPSGSQTNGTNFNSKITSQSNQFVPGASIGSKVQTGGITLKDKLSVSPSALKTLPSSSTGMKIPQGGITFKDKLNLQPGLKLGTGITPPSGGSTPPSGGKTSPMKKDKDHDDFPYWLWFSPAFYGNGYGNWGYSSAPAYSQVSVSSPVVVEQTPVTPVPSDTTPTGKLTMKLGESYTIDNTNFGERAGELSLSISGLTLPVRVDNWTSQEISFTIPGVGLVKATDGMFQISNADHQLALAVAVTVVPAR
jgi:hypothetical protein